MVFAGLASVLAFLSAVGVLVLLARRDVLYAAGAAMQVLGFYWFAAGAWLRTTRGKPDLGEPPPGPPALSTAWARRYVIGAATCGLACCVALLVQFIQARA
jgi:hypothetical protein